MPSTESEIEENEFLPDEPAANIISDSAPTTKDNQRFRFFSRPRLSRSLILVALLLIITNIYVALINQPASYWLDYGRAVYTAPAIEIVMAKGPLLFAGICVVYLLLVWLALAFLPRYPALVLWMALCFLHLRDTIYWSRCGLNRIYYEPGNQFACGVLDFLLIVFGAGILGLVLARSWFSKETVAEGDSDVLIPKRKFSGKVALAAVAWLSFLTLTLVRAAALPDSGWIPIVADLVPAPRIDGKIAFDTNRGRAVLFGGATSFLGGNDWVTENDTWEWDGENWIVYTREINPPARISHALAYDERRGVTVLFGGKNHLGPLTDTWEWDGTNWTQKFPTINPPPRCCHHMYYDSDSGKVRIYGGYDGVSFYSDIWEWDGQEWRHITFDSPNPVASGFGLAYDSDRNQLVTFLDGFPAGTWTLRENHWSNPQFDSAPPQRSNLSLAYDKGSGKHVLFGGVQDRQFFDDTWLLDEEWQELNSPLAPPGRWGHTLFYDENRGRIVMFGGFDGKSFLNDMWELVITEP